MGSWQLTGLWRRVKTRPLHNQTLAKGWFAGGVCGDSSAAAAAAVAWPGTTHPRNSRKRPLEELPLTLKHHQHQPQLIKTHLQHLRSLCNQVWIYWRLLMWSHLIQKSPLLRFESNPNYLSVAQLNLQGHHHQQLIQPALTRRRKLWRTRCLQWCWCETTRFVARRMLEALEQLKTRTSKPGWLRLPECCTTSNWWRLRKGQATTHSTALQAVSWVTETRQQGGTTVQQCLCICTGNLRSEAGSCHLFPQLQPESLLCLARPRHPSNWPPPVNETYRSGSLENISWALMKTAAPSRESWVQLLLHFAILFLFFLTLWLSPLRYSMHSKNLCFGIL